MLSTCKNLTLFEKIHFLHSLQNSTINKDMNVELQHFRTL